MVLDSDLECFRLMDNLLPSSSDTLVDDLKPTLSSSRYEEVTFLYSNFLISVSCPEQSCRTVTDDFHLIEQHYSTCHQHFCSLCGLSFISSRLLSVHEQIVHRGLFKPKLNCFLSRCPQMFCNPAELFMHAHNSHGLSPDSPILIGASLDVKDYSVRIVRSYIGYIYYFVNYNSCTCSF
ncbi:cupin domain [Schistosoma japonicum]|nr:cupin domain [Schistosoma japonicum]KAH8852022.1 cupin domain [Schistosoma japonicum]